MAKKYNTRLQNKQDIIVKESEINLITYLYRLMSHEQKEKYAEPFPKFPPPPLSQQKATPEEIEEYNRISKRLNQLPETKRIIKRRDLIRIAYIHNKMSREQENKAEPFPAIVPPPPLPPYPATPKNPSTALLELQERLTEKSNEYAEAVRLRSKENKGKMSTIILLGQEALKLRKAYVDLVKKESANIPPPPPPVMDTISTYNGMAKRAKLIPDNRQNNIQYLKTLFNKMSDSKKEKVENPERIIKYTKQLDNLTAEQMNKVKKVLSTMKANAKAKGRKFYSAAEYKKLEALYASMLSN